MSDVIAPQNTPTPILGLNKPAVDGDIDIWGDLTNANWDILDKVLLTTGGTMTGQLIMPLGTATQPALVFGASDGTGIWRSADILVLNLKGQPALALSGTLSQFYMPLNMLSNPIQQVANPTNAQDVATKAYVDARAWQEAPNNTTTYGRRAQAWASVVPFSARGSIVNGYAEPTNIAQSDTVLSPFAVHGNIGFNVYSDGANWRYLGTGYAKLISFDGGGGMMSWFGFPNGTAGNVATPVQLATLDTNGNFVVAGMLKPASGDNGIAPFSTGGYLTLAGTQGPLNYSTFVINGGGRATYAYEFYYFTTRIMTVDVNGALVITSTASKPGGGTWADSSDARIKTVEGDYTHGLAELLQLRPVNYRFIGNDHHAPTEGRPYIGLVAQDVEDAMPELVSLTSGTIDGEEIDDIRMLDQSPLLFALVNAIKELSARLVALETRRMA